MFEGFPGEDVADRVESPGSQAREMGMCTGEGKRSVGERDGVSIEELSLCMGGNVGCRGEFGVARDVDAVEGHLSIGRVAKGVAIDAEAVGGHLVLI